MVDFDFLEQNKDQLRFDFSLAKPFSYLVTPLEDADIVKKLMAKHYNTAVQIKNELNGGTTTKNQ